MLSALVRFAIERRAVVLVLALALSVFGAWRLAGAGLDIFPEFAPQLVVVQTEAPGFTAEQVEMRVTQPLEAALGGLIDLDHVRSESIQGLSIVTLVFAEDSDTYRNRAQVTERLATVRAELPAAAAEPVIAPLASSSATVRTIGLVADDDDLLRLRDLTTTVVVPRLLGVAGVADVNVFGGETRALVVAPDLVALERFGLALGDLERALAAAGANPGLGVVENANQQIAITSVVTGGGPAAIAGASLGVPAAPWLTIGDVARVGWGALPRISAAQVMGRPAVVMMVIGQLGANTLTVSDKLDGAFADLEPVLAQQGVTLHSRLFVPANYITTAIGDIARHLLIGGSLVLLVLLVGLYNLRTALISALAIPLSLLAAVIVLIECGVNLNVLVIGGLAIALGEVVDDAIIDTENIYRRLRTAPPGESFESIALAASLEVRGSVVYATFIVALVFVPLLTLGGVSGRLFAPLGLAYILAVIASLLVAVTVTPALCVSLLARRAAGRDEAPVFRLLNPWYTAAVAALARRPGFAVAASAASAVFVLAVLPGFGARFLPDLREGHFIVHTTALPGTSLDQSIAIGTRLAEAFMDIDGVHSVSQWAGRAERGADTYGSHYSEYEVALEPMGGARQQDVLDALRAILARHAGLSFEANTFLTERIDETISGYTAPVVVNLFGRDLDRLDAKGRELAALVAAIPGARGVRLRASHTTPNLTIALDPARLARHGLDVAGVLGAVEAAYAGATVNELHRGTQRVPVVVLLPAAVRAAAGALAELVVAHGPGGPVRLGDVAEVVQTAGRYNVLHRNGQRLQVVTADVAGRDLAGFMAELRARVFERMRFPDGMHVEFTGAAVEQAAARSELVWHAALCGLGVLLLIYMAVGRLRYLLLIALNLPFSLAGGVAAVMLAGGVVSVGSVVGFVTLFGITVRNSIMLVSHYDHLVRVEGEPWNLTTALRGARERLPAILMTALVTALAMLPLTIDSDNPGREIMGPMAAIIVGGLCSSTVLNLLVMPALLCRFGHFAPAAPRRA
ncbi:MAG: efflux RND transporter permease subunit [Gammaproteobacteria bacterium]|nr:efflux RND transporter permease subunit [Gammaproteobacteria bacterium]